MRVVLAIIGSLALCLVTDAFAQPDTLWTRTYGGSGDEYASSITQSDDGGFIVVGSSNSFRSWMEVYVLGLDGIGNVVWTRQYSEGENTWGVQGAERDSETLAVLANSGEDWLDAYFCIYWVRSPDGRSPYLSPRGFTAGALRFRGMYVIVVGTLLIGGNHDRGFLEVQSWMPLIRREYGHGFCAGFKDVIVAGDGYLMTGYSRASAGAYDDFFLVRADSLGDTLWTRVYGGAGFDSVTSVVEVNGDFVFTGPTDSYGENGDFFLMKVSIDGDSLWSRTYGGAGEDHSRRVVRTPDGGFLLVGGTDSFGEGGDVLIVKADSLGNELWRQTYGGPEHDEAQSVVVADDGGYVIAATTRSYAAGGSDIWVLRIAPESMGAHDRSYSVGDFSLAQNYPNPFNATTRIMFTLSTAANVSLWVFDTTGREVANLLEDSRMNAGEHEIGFDGSGLPTGLYFYRIATEGTSLTRKMVLLK